MRSEAQVTREDGVTRLHISVTGTIDRPLAEVAHVLRDIDAFAAWFPGIEEWNVQDSGARSARVHGSQPFPWPLRDRDYVVRYAWQDGEAGTFQVDAVALVDASPIPASGVVRIEDMHTRWTLRADGERTLTRYEYEGAPGMRLPRWLQRYSWESHTNAVLLSLAQEVERRAALSR